MTKSEVVTLFDYDKWATNAQLKVVTGLNDEQYNRNLGTSFGGIHGTLVHIFGAQRVWLTRWKGEAPTALPGAEELPTLVKLTERWNALRDEIGTFLQSLSDEKLAQRLAYKDLKGNSYSQPLVHQMQHLINHSTYHRGQITTMLRQVGATPIGTDLIGYYRML